MKLTAAQSAALKHIESYARGLSTAGQAELDNVLEMSNITLQAYAEAEQQIKTFARVGLQFHPDRISRNGMTVVDSLLNSGEYQNQFETYLSNGKLDPVVGGERASWEDRMFNGVFTEHRAELSERPKYGALNIMLHADGPCPRFGSCYILLKPEVSKRCTFTYMDSHRNPVEKGSLNCFSAIMAALMTECFERRFALGQSNISPSELISHLRTRLKAPFPDLSKTAPARNLNHYIEAQVHGDISLLTDADFIVADSSYKGSSTENDLELLCRRYDIELCWHRGFRLRADQVPDDFRGPAMPSLAERVAQGGYVDACTIGQAAADLKNSPSGWTGRGSYEVVLQELKCLWHVVVQYGDIVT